uniref:ATP synthase F1 subunit epsilon n=1 Tax=Tabanus bromius TaxID=304241 RepID=A0A0K8TTD6_TABBR
MNSVRVILSRSGPGCLRYSTHQMGELGSGAGHGGGAGGSIREAGGAFGRLEAAREEEYFHKKQQEQLKKLNTENINQVEYHQKRIHDHEEAIDKHKEFLKNLLKKD